MLRKRLRFKRTKKQQLKDHYENLEAQLAHVREIVEGAGSAESKLKSLQSLFAVDQLTILEIPLAATLYIALCQRANEQDVDAADVLQDIIIGYLKNPYTLTINDFQRDTHTQTITIELSVKQKQKLQELCTKEQKTLEVLMRYLGSHYIRG